MSHLHDHRAEWQQAEGMPEHHKHLFDTAQSPLLYRNGLFRIECRGKIR